MEAGTRWPSFLSEQTFINKTLIVTGGTRGIGRATVELAADLGANVLFTYQSSSSGQLAEAICSRHQGKNLVRGFKVDVSGHDQCGEFITMVEKEFGGIDCLINNAGIIRDGLLMTMEQEDWNQVIQTNISGLYNMIRPTLPGMLRKRKGSIVNLSSIAATKPGRGHSNYAASKGAVESFTKALAAEIGGKGIRVNAVAPGMIATDMSQDVRDAAGDEIKKHIALKRFGTPEEIAQTILFLASDASSYITGTVIHADGGAR